MTALLTLDEAATYLSVSRTWLEDAAQRGQVTRVRLGRQVRFTHAALDDLIARNTVPAVTARALPAGLPQPVGRRRTA